jgi:hypothetical protein
VNFTGESFPAEVDMLSRSALAFSLILVFATTGCSLGKFPDPAVSSQPMQGVVRGGQQPIASSRIYLMQAGTTTGASSVSLLTSGDGTDAVGTYVLTNSSGFFNLTGLYTCTPNTQVYALALGGITVRTTSNAAISEMAVLGNCPSSGNFVAATPTIFISEVTTVAAAYALSGFMTDARHVSSSGTPLAETGLANAFATAANLADLTTGNARTAPVGHSGTVPQAELNTLANALAGCVNSDGLGAGCTDLFADAKNGTSTPTDTASAAVNIAHNPTANVAAIWALGTPEAPFQPALTAAPNDWSVGVIHNVSQAPTASPLIDATGKIWFSNDNGIASLTPLGASSTTTGFAAVNYLAGIDSSARVWGLSPSLGYTTNGVTYLETYDPSAPSWTSDGLSGAFDGAGNLWVATFNSGILGEIVNPANSVGTYGSFTPGGLAGCTYMYGVAIDSAQNVWATCYSTSKVVKVSNAGTTLSGASGFGNVTSPTKIVIDGSDDAWILNNGGTLTALDSTGNPLPGSPYTIPEQPRDLMVDGAGNIWVASYTRLYEFSPAGALLTPSGLIAPTSSYYGMAIDGSGNIWLPSFNGNLFAEYIGAAAPVVTPITYNKHGVRP